MNLPEKILYCRKKTGLSQEALADQIGVSRQAVSKWETGDASPEISKLLLLAKCFDVSTDWLLSEEGPPQKAALSSQPDSTAPSFSSDWIDSLPGMIGQLVSQYGWLAGVHIAGSGAIFIGLGALSLFILDRMFQTMAPAPDMMFPGSSGFVDSGFAASPFPDFLSNNPASLMAKAFILIGLIFLIAGIVLAVLLKQRSRHDIDTNAVK